MEGEPSVYPLNVVLVEDDPMVREVHRQFINRMDGFSIVGDAANGREGLQIIKRLEPDLAIIDLYMPQLGGLDMLKVLRSEGICIDVIAITAASDIDSIHRVLQQGAVDYIIKPFTFERMKKSLENYKFFRARLEEKKDLLQDELDEILFLNTKEVQEKESLPKGLHQNTLTKVSELIALQKDPVSADEVAENIGIARITARRYLDFLEKEGKVKLHIQYGGVGRPMNRYGVN
jgi:two-component system, CitB family, response regulator DctR